MAVMIRLESGVSSRDNARDAWVAWASVGLVGRGWRSVAVEHSGPHQPDASMLAVERAVRYLRATCNAELARCKSKE